MKYNAQNERRLRLGEQLENDTLAIFRSGERNFFYLTGLNDPEIVLVMRKQNEGLASQLFIPRHDSKYELFNGKAPGVDEYKDETCIDEVYYMDRYDEEIDKPIKGGALQEVDLTSKLSRLRVIKSPEEVDDIREAIRLTGLGIETILENVSPGATENEMQAYFDFVLRSKGATGNAFNPIVAGGANSLVLHYEKNNAKLMDGDLLLLDLGAEYNHYSADISRTIPVNGKFTERQKYYYDAVLAAQSAVINALKPGLIIDAPTEIARDVLFGYCKETGVAKDREDMEKLLPHGVSHYLGLDTHDVGARAELAPGMVITVEPGIYLPELGLGIRIEDDVLITEEGCEVLSSDIVKTPDEIEARMLK